MVESADALLRCDALADGQMDTRGVNSLPVLIIQTVAPLGTRLVKRIVVERITVGPKADTGLGTKCPAELFSVDAFPLVGNESERVGVVVATGDALVPLERLDAGCCLEQLVETGAAGVTALH